MKHAVTRYYLHGLANRFNRQKDTLMLQPICREAIFVVAPLRANLTPK